MAELGPHSRYRLAFTVRDEDRELNYVLLRSKRLTFDPTVENLVYKGQSGDNLFTVAARHYRGFPRPASLFWLVGEYQPTPILDPWQDLEGRELYIPPADVVQTLLREDETTG